MQCPRSQMRGAGHFEVPPPHRASRPASVAIQSRVPRVIFRLLALVVLPVVRTPCVVGQDDNILNRGDAIA